jgi:hypothetical protein
MPARREGRRCAAATVQSRHGAGQIRGRPGGIGIVLAGVVVGPVVVVGGYRLLVRSMERVR